MTVTIENTYTQSGSTTDYGFTFPYLDTTDIKVSLDGVATTAYSLLNATTVRFNTAPSSGTAIRIYRETAYTNPKATFYPGSAIRAGDLNDNTLQNLYVTQEANDKVANAWLTGDPTVVSSESWYTTDDTKIASTKAIENRINTQIDSALTGDVVAGSSITIADNSPSSGKITVSVNAATTSASGSMSASDKSKLDGIESNATADQTNAEIRTAVEAATDSNVFTDADHSKLNAIEASATADQTDAEIRTAVENATDSNVFTDADHTKLNGIEASATADQTAAEIKTAYESNAQTNPLTDAEKAVIDGVTANTSEINKLDGVTATTTNLNIVSGKTFRASGDGTLSTTSDTEIPSSKVIATHVASAVSNVGGFVTIANEASFPTTANQPANGVIISISDAAGTVVNGSGVSTTGRTTDGTPATVTINNFPSSLNSETLASGVALLVTSTGSSNTYNYHKILAAETDVKSLSDDINDFNARYRVAGSAPGSNNDDGDLWFDTSANKMKVYNATGSSWDDVASVGQFFINTLSSSGSASDTIPGGSATFNGTAKKFTLSNPATGGAQQLLVSVNGVLQKPNSGSSVPSEGFAISGNDIIFSAAPASGSDYFIVTQGSSVSIGTPSANSVNSSHIIDGSIVNADVSNSADIAGSKVADDSIPEAKLDVHNAPATGKYLKYTSNGMEWSDGASEGTDVKSTGESGTAKFLRVDGDGTCSWQVPPVTDISGKANLSGADFTGEVALKGNTHQLKFYDDDDSAYLHLKAPSTVASNVDWTLPAADGSANQYLKTDGSGNLSFGTITVPPAGNTFTAVANGAIANNKPVKIDTDGKVSEIKSTTTTGNQHYGLATNGYGQVSSADVHPHSNRIAYNSDDDMYVAISVENASGGKFVYYTGVPNSYASSAGGITWSSVNQIHTGNGHRDVSICYAGNSRFLIVYRDTGANKTVQRILKWNSGSSSASLSSDTVIDGVSNSVYRGTQTVKIATDRVAILCRSDSANSKWPDGIPGVIIGDITDDTTWTYRNQQRCTATTNSSDHGAKDEHYSIAYNSTDNNILCTWMKTAGGESLRTVAMSVASGTSATITKGSDIELESDDEAGNQSTVWHSGQNKFVIAYTFDGSSTDAIRSKIATVDSSSLAITLSSAIDKTGLDNDETDYNIKLVLNNFGTIYAYFIMNNNHIGVITAPDFNGSTLSWSNYSNNSSIYAGSYESVDVVMGGSGSGYRHVYFGEATSGSDTIYISYKTQQSTSNLTDAEQYVGFADQAYTNGQTATISTYGNNVNTLSGMTIGSPYYIQGDGSLATTVDSDLSLGSNRPLAGTALSASKLLIRDPLAKA